MEVLVLNDPETTARAEEQLPLLHLLLGDSVARDSGMRTRAAQDAFFCAARGGATWSSLAERLPGVLEGWSREAAAQERRRGSVVVWMSGNDVYSQQTLLPSYSDDSLEKAAQHAVLITKRLLAETSQVLVLGPLPRLSGDMIGLSWEQSAFFQLERRLLHRLPSEVTFVTLGRQLTRKSLGKHTLTHQCLEWYALDRTHLSRSGYGKLAGAAKFPDWLKLAAAE